MWIVRKNPVAGRLFEAERKKRAIFHHPGLVLGGAEVSLLRMLSGLADRGWKITLVVTMGGGLLKGKLDRRIKLVCLQPSGSYGRSFYGATGFVEKVNSLPDFLAYRFVQFVGRTRMLRFPFQRYSAAATTLHNTSTRFCRRVVRAGVRLHWIHTDLSQVKLFGKTTDAIRHAVPEIDHYICVSEVVRRSLVEIVPETSKKASVIYNILDAREIRKKMLEGADPFPPHQSDMLRVVTVCRLHEASKGLRRMVRVCKKLADLGIRFQWFVVGDGPDRTMFEEAIKESKCEAKLILMGQLLNPFPAYHYADLVAMLSHYEGLSTTINEAKVAGKPVVATCVSGVDEQLVDGETAVIVDNNEEAIVEGMQRVLSDPALRYTITNDQLPPALLDDSVKLDRLEQLMQGGKK